MIKGGSRTSSDDAADDPRAPAKAERPPDARLILDWDEKADLLAWAIANDRVKLASRWFSQHGYSSPEIVWDLPDGPVCDAATTSAYAMWRGLIKEHPIPAYVDVAAQIDQVDHANMSLLEAVDGGRDYRYQRFAAGVAAVEGRDWVGRRLSEYAAQSYRGVFYLALYRVLTQRRCACLVRHQTEDPLWGAYFCRVLMPLGDAFGRVVGFTNANAYQHTP